MEKKALWVSEAFFNKIRNQDGRNDEERIKNLLEEGDQKTEYLTEKEIKDLIEEKIEEEKIKNY